MIGWLLVNAPEKVVHKYAEKLDVETSSEEEIEEIEIETEHEQ